MTKVKWMGSSKAVIKVNEAWSFKGSNVKKKTYLYCIVGSFLWLHLRLLNRTGRAR